MIAAATAAALLLMSGAAPTPEATAAVIRYKYGSNPAQVVEVYPSTARRWVMVVHGGSWAAGSLASGHRAAGVLAAGGFRVFNIDYRKTTDYPGAPGAGWPAQRDDVLTAIAWVKSHAGQFGIDPDRGAVYGFSAGGHLAAQAGLYGNGGARVRAIVSVSGVLQPHRVVDVASSSSSWGGDKPTPANRTLAAWESVAMRCPRLPWTACSHRWTDFLPQTHISADDPPVLIFQGTSDPSVPPQTGPAFRYWLSWGHVPSTLIQCVHWTHTESCALDGGWRQRLLIDFLTARTR